MIDDPIVKEIREIRQTYAEEFDNDLHAICEDLRRQERESARDYRTPQQHSSDNSRQQGSAVTNR
jgi:hypothetical protein